MGERNVGEAQPNRQRAARQLRRCSRGGYCLVSDEFISRTGSRAVWTISVGFR